MNGHARNVESVAVDRQANVTSCCCVENEMVLKQICVSMKVLMKKFIPILVNLVHAVVCT